MVWYGLIWYENFPKGNSLICEGESGVVMVADPVPHQISHQPVPGGEGARMQKKEED